VKNEYVLTDSAFSPSVHVVPAFKSLDGGQMDANHSHYNDLLATT